ncbi:hypothetical protein NSA24_04510 [Clostridioides mangenotii]|jgi:hypothetical protein|uniref:hypothetical protein n=1 Tax=Metaclostridioides mangenotii TaxID=1540 RepID=UPI000464DBC0|nr:hypothetical protein [Clostridioides mangenotii]MCR1954098.1 hypothetical protein [Clostridioides mangenotii]
MHRNLEAEFIRKNINKDIVAKTIKRTRRTLDLKIQGRFPFTYDEAVEIQERYFPECDLKDLFRKSEESKNN